MTALMAHGTLTCQSDSSEKEFVHTVITVDTDETFSLINDQSHLL